MRHLAALLLTLIVLAGLLLLAEREIARTAEERVSAQIAQALDAPAQAELHGWPVTWHLLSGTLPQVDVRARDVPLGDAEASIDELDVWLSEVDLSWEELTGAANELPSARTARFEARIDGETAQALLGIPDEVVMVDLRHGSVALDIAGFVEIEADVDADDGIILVRPRDGIAALVGLAEIPIDLSDEPGNPHVQEARVTPEEITISGTLEGMNRDGRD